MWDSVAQKEKEIIKLHPTRIRGFEMRKILLFCSIILFVSCGEKERREFPMTNFYVKNTSDKTIRFDASVIQRGIGEVSLPFTVHSNDSVLARRIGFLRDGDNPQKWFHRFVIHPVEGIQMNDPNLPENWVKSGTYDEPIYVFTINKE